MTVSGRFVYQDDSAAWHGIAYASVTLYDYDCNSGDDPIAGGLTDANGYFSLSGYFDEGGGECSDDAADLYVVVSANNGSVLVKLGDSDDIFSYRTEVFWDVCGNVDVGTWSPPPGDDAAYHILNTLLQAWQYMSAYTEPDPPVVTVRWPFDHHVSYYSDEEIHIIPIRTWDEGTYVHEYGHFIQDHYLGLPGFDYCNGICDGEACGHCGCGAENPPVVYLEGWPDYLANAVNVQYGHDTPYNFEAPCKVHGREDFQNIEAYWAAVFWDIHDGNNDDHDNDGLADSLSCGFANQWNVMMTYHPTTLVDFYNAWCAMYPSLKEGLWRTMYENHIYMTDLSEPDDTCPAPMWHSLAPDGSTEWHVLDTPGDQDWFRVNVMGPLVTYKIETLETGKPGLGCSDTILKLYDSDCTTLLAENNDFGGKLCSLISFSQHDSSGKPCFLNVSSGYYGHGPYGIRLTVNCSYPDPYEPNDDCYHRKTVAVGGSPIEAKIFPAGDQDWFQFIAVKGMTYVVETQPLQPNVACTDTVLTVCSTCGCNTVVAENDDYGDSACSRVTWTADYPGQVVVKVRGHADSHIGPYKLSVTCQADAYEPDDTCPPTHTIVPGSDAQELNLCGQGDEDWVRFQALCGMTYVIQTRNLLEDVPCTDTVLELYANDCETLLASNDNVSAQNRCSRIQWTANYSEYLYIRVRGATPSTSGIYGLSVTPVADQFEPDDTCAQARPIGTDGSVQARSAWPAFDEDWVTFDVTTGWGYRIETLPWATCVCIDTKLYLYAADCTTLLASNDNYGGGLCSRIEWTSDRTSPVFVKIVAHTLFGATPGSYGLRVRTISPYPIADFIWTPPDPTCADTVQFRDNSSNGVGHQIVSWAWDFGDGGTATGENPTHQFADNGQYRVCLTVTDDATPPQQSTTCHTITVANACPTPVFAFQPASPAPLQQVQFSNRSSDPCGSIVSCLWDFGDGTTLSDCGAMVTHIYQAPGFYDVCLTVTDDDGCQQTVCQTIGVYCQPTAAFSWSPENPTCADSIQFTDQSTIGQGCTITQWAWDFGDGQISEEQNPTHKYEDDGVYQVCHMAMDSQGTEHTICQMVTVTNTCPTAAFSFGPGDPEGPGLVVGSVIAFQSESTDPCGSIASWSWDFGDGNTSPDAAPTHVFSAEGTYHVCLTVTDDDGCADTVCHDVAIGPNCGPIPAFAWQPQKPTCADAIQFSGRATDRAGCNIVSWAWDFGDGHTSTDQNPTHRFADDGLYLVGLTVTDSANVSNTVRQMVQVGPACPVASFEYAPAQPTCAGQVTFTNTSTDPCGSIASCSWDFGDGTTSDECNPQHVFSAAGSYVVGLTVTDDDNCSTTVRQTVVVADTTPPAVTCPPDVNVVSASLDCVVVDIGQAACTDNCDPNCTVTNDAPPCFTPGTHTVTWTCTDASGNSASCQQTVTVTTTADASVRQFRCPKGVRAGTTRPLVAVVENKGSAACTIDVRIERTGPDAALLCTQTVALAPGERREVRCDYTFRAQDVPQACFVARILPASDANPANNERDCCTDVKPPR